MAKINALILTTEGCCACSIMKNIMKTFVDKYPNTLEVEDINYKDAPTFIKQNVSLTDFPTTVFYKGSIIIDKVQGTISIKKIKEIIDKNS